jgi:uncharacterized protein YjdB
MAPSRSFPRLNLRGMLGLLVCVVLCASAFDCFSGSNDATVPSDLDKTIVKLDRTLASVTTWPVDTFEVSYFSFLNSRETAVGDFDATVESSNPGVVRVLSSGTARFFPDGHHDPILVAVLQAGEAQITVTPLHVSFAGGTVRAKIGITAFNSAPSILDVPSSVSLRVGAKLQLSAVPKNTSGAFSSGGSLGTNRPNLMGNAWSVPDSKVVTLAFGSGGSGTNPLHVITFPEDPIVITGVAAGRTTLRVEFDHHETVFMTRDVIVTVTTTDPAVKIVSSPAGPPSDPSSSLTSLAYNGTRQYQLLDQENAVLTSGVTWGTVEQAPAASISPTGLFTCASYNDVPIHVNVRGVGPGGLTDIAPVTCLAAPPSTFAISPSPGPSIQPNQHTTLTGVVSVGDPTRAVVWASRNPNIADVVQATNRTATLTAVAPGQVWILAAFTPQAFGTTLRDSVLVTVAPPTAIKMYVSPNPVVVRRTLQRTLTATVINGLSGVDVEWVSRNAAIASVTKSDGRNAQLTGVATGKTWIIGTFGNGAAFDSTEVTVMTTTSPPVATIQLLPADTTIKSGSVLQYRVRYLDFNGQETAPDANSTTTFQVDSSPVASIGATTGLLTAKGTTAASSPLQAVYRVGTGAGIIGQTHINVIP